jgi:hypothetical protein
MIFSIATDNVTRRESGSGSSKRVVCYYTNWSVYRPGTAKFSPQNINPYLCTHLIYAFGGLTRDNSLRPYDKYQDIEQGTSLLKHRATDTNVTRGLPDPERTIVCLALLIFRRIIMVSVVPSGMRETGGRHTAVRRISKTKSYMSVAE